MRVHVHIYKGVEYRIIEDQSPVIKKNRVVTWQRNVRVLFRPYVTVARFTAYFVCGKDYIEELIQSTIAADALCSMALSQYNRWVVKKRQDYAKH